MKQFFTGYGNPGLNTAAKYIGVEANANGVRIGLLSSNITTSDVNFSIYYRI